MCDPSTLLDDLFNLLQPMAAEVQVTSLGLWLVAPRLPECTVHWPWQRQVTWLVVGSWLAVRSPPTWVYTSPGRSSAESRDRWRAVIGRAPTPYWVSPGRRADLPRPPATIGTKCLKYFYWTCERTFFPIKIGHDDQYFRSELLFIFKN